jgi:hypothetical protein
LPDFKTKASWLLTQNVLWGAWLDLPSGVSEFYFGPSHRFVPLDSLPDQTVKVKSSFHTRTSTGLHFLLYRADIPWRSTDYFIDIGTKPNAFQRVVCDPVCTEFPFENVPVNVESYWVQFPDDTFSILTDRNSLLIPGPVFDIPESDDSNRLDAPCRGCAGPLAVVAGGTLGLGYALSKLFGG